MLHDELRLAVACGTRVLGVEEGVKHCEATAAVLRLSSMEILRSQCIPVKCCGRLVADMKMVHRVCRSLLVLCGTLLV